MGQMAHGHCPGCDWEGEIASGLWPNGLVIEPRICPVCRDLMSVAMRTWEGYGGGGRWIAAPAVPPLPIGRCPECASEAHQPWPGDVATGGPCPRCRGEMVSTITANVD